MKHFRQFLLLLVLIYFPGCALICGVPPEAQSTAKENAHLCDSFVTMMDAGTTNREQEQKFIRAVRRAWHAQNYALNDMPLPRDVEVWFKRQKLGLSNNNSGENR